MPERSIRCCESRASWRAAAIPEPSVGDIYVEAGSRATRWRLREIWKEVCVLESLAEPNRSRYLTLNELLRTRRYANEKSLIEE